MSLKYADVATFVTGAVADDDPPVAASGLLGLGYGTTAKPMPVLNPGPFAVERLHKISPQAMLFLQIGNGVGLTVESLYDQVFITARSVGKQSDYYYAEDLAQDVDRLLLNAVNGVMLGSAHTLYVARTGGAPQLVNFDAGDRYHFQATYLTEVKR